MKVIITCMFLLLSGCSDLTKVETLCNTLRGDYQALQKQLPLQSDMATTLVGIEAFYLPSKDECYSTLTSNINVNSFIAAVAQSNPTLNEEKVKLFFQGGEGEEKLKEIIRSKFNKKSETKEFPTQIKGFTYKEIYSFSGAPIDKLVLERKF